jgi:DNA-binding transcriptional MerR regulator
MNTAQVEYFETSDVARALGTTVGALYQMERRKTLPPPSRTPGGRRVFTRQDVEFIRALRASRRKGGKGTKPPE